MLVGVPGCFGQERGRGGEGERGRGGEGERGRGGGGGEGGTRALHASRTKAGPPLRLPSGSGSSSDDVPSQRRKRQWPRGADCLCLWASPCKPQIRASDFSHLQCHRGTVCPLHRGRRPQSHRWKTGANAPGASILFGAAISASFSFVERASEMRRQRLHSRWRQWAPTMSRRPLVFEGPLGNPRTSGPLTQHNAQSRHAPHFSLCCSSAVQVLSQTRHGSRLQCTALWT